MPKKQPTYEQAMQRLDDIVNGLEKGTAELDQLSSQIKEAQALLAFCRAKLLQVETDVNQILNDGKE